jgi:hypothetical protein
LSKYLVCNARNKPLSKVVSSNRTLGKKVVGYGPPVYLSALEVKEANTALQTISEDDFKAKFNVSAMQKNDIYLIPDDDKDASDFLEYCLDNFIILQEFFAKAAQDDKYIIFYMV